MKRKQSEVEAVPVIDPVFRIRGAQQVKGIPVHVISQELQSLAAANNNDLTPRMVLDAARPAEAPLHNLFEWDNKKASEKWRLHQARHLIIELRIDNVRQFYHANREVVVDQKLVKRQFFKEPEHFEADEAQSAFDVLHRQLQGVQRSIDNLRNLLAGKHDPDRVAMFEAAAQAFAIAREALRRIQ